MMKICSNCGRSYGNDWNDDNPAITLGEMFTEEGDSETADTLCPECRERFGFDDFIGFWAVMIDERRSQLL